MVGSNLKQRFHHEITFGKKRMRQSQYFQVGHIALVIKDIQIARARTVLLFADATQPVFNDIQIAQKLLRGQARTQDKHRINERVLAFHISRLAFVEAGNIDDLRIRQ